MEGERDGEGEGEDGHETLLPCFPLLLSSSFSLPLHRSDKTAISKPALGLSARPAARPASPTRPLLHCARVKVTFEDERERGRRGTATRPANVF